jgi:predicted transcriptional regulator
MTERELFLGLTADIISAHVSNNAVPADQLPTLIHQVFNTLSTAEQKALLHPTRNRPCPSSSRRERITLCASTAVSTSRC